MDMNEEIIPSAKLKCEIPASAFEFVGKHIRWRDLTNSKECERKVGQMSTLCFEHFSLWSKDSGSVEKNVPMHAFKTS